MSRSRQDPPRRSSKARSGPRRGSLSRDAIRRTALRIADAEGLAALTVRKIATRLDVSPMAVYRHFESKAEIVDGLVDLVVAESRVTDHDEPRWQDWLRRTLLQMRRALLEHPGILPLLGAAAFSGAEALAVTERVLAVLRRAGLGDESADLYQTLIAFTVGSVALESSASARLPSASGSRAAERGARLALESLSVERHPNVVALAPRLARFASEERFLAELDRIVAATSVA